MLLEANYIKKYVPKYNARLRDGKRYPLIRITIKDKYPKVLIVRNTNDNESLYFGPFPNSGAMRLVLKTIRRIFPFQSVVNHPKRLCLYNHLGLCPCPEVSIIKETPSLRSLLVKEYKKNISHIIDFLKGNTKKVIKNLENERNTLSKNEEFEKAQQIQKKIDAILFVTSPAYERFDYKLNVNLDEDLRQNELSDLRLCLAQNNIEVKALERIECYDISNISGQHATGSMVVFINGQKDASQYRKFKIKSIDNVPNDFAMMQEVLFRRLNHKEWPMPDLIIVDGGKGQVSAALKAVKVQELTIPVVGLAKKEETIVIPLIPHSGERQRLQNPFHESVERFWTSQNDDEGSFIEISLPKDSRALHLVMRIRDEAHRFAVAYHRKLRSLI